MATDRSFYLALSELSRRYADPTAASRGGTLTACELCCFSEDGVVAEILGRIGVAERFFVESGVESGCEGKCVFLADVQEWAGLFIEADGDHFRRLANKYAATDRVRAANAAMTPDNVEELFAGAGVPAKARCPVDRHRRRGLLGLGGDPRPPRPGGGVTLRHRR